VDLPGLDANGGPLYIGTGCFHRREALCGRRYSNENKVEWKEVNDRKVKESAGVLEEVSRILASCTYEANTEWGKEVPLSLSNTSMHSRRTLLHAQINGND
jgi:hypothetical protein